MSRRHQTRLSVYVMVVIVLLLSAVWTLDRIRILHEIRDMMQQQSRY
jgi:hypothetical protein